MPWRGVAPIQLVIWLVGCVALVTAFGMVVIGVAQVVQGQSVDIPSQLVTVCVGALGALGGLLAPNTGLTTSARTARHAAVAGQAAATAVLEHEHMHDIAVEASGLTDERKS